MSDGGKGAWTYLVWMLRQDPSRARGMVAEHALDEDGRCAVCRGGGDSSGRSHGCRLGDAARAALRTRSINDARPQPVGEVMRRVY